MLHTLFFLIFFQTSYIFANQGDCGRKNVNIIYSHDIDYSIACNSLVDVFQITQKELGYKTNTYVQVEFKDSVLFSLFDPQGVETSREPVYGLYLRRENRVEMSSFNSSIVQNRDRSHFGLKIKTMPISDLKKMELLRKMHQSVVTHEITHLLTQFNFHDDNPSPAIHEYFSYVIQLKTLQGPLLNEVLAINPDVFTHEMQINSMIHFADPHKFGIMSYRHFETLGDKKSKFIEDALSGKFRPDDMLDFL